MMETVDSKLSEFTTRTAVDPGLGRDLLEAHNWDLKNAINAYYIMKGMGGSHLNNSDGEEDEDDIQDDVFDDNSSLRLASRPKVGGRMAHMAAFSLSVQGAVSKCSSEPSLSSPSTPAPPDGININIDSRESSTTSSPSKLAISKQDVTTSSTLDELQPVKLARGISRATDNVNLVSKARSEFAQDFRLSSRGSRVIIEKRCQMGSLMTETPDYTFTLPDLSIHPPDFSEFLEKDLIEKSSLVSLEGAGRLNWWSEAGICQKLWPLATTGDGNCLLHAASLGMWGFHDRLLTLRKALHSILGSSRYSESFYRRWRWQSSMQNKPAGLILCEDEWKREWQTLLKMASSEPRVRAAQSTTSTDVKKPNGGKKIETLPEDEMQPHVYESLEEIHILALAHVLQRPIIVIADTMLKDVKGEPFAPIPFGGIYLPLECCPSECHKSPLCLTYDAAHFSALVAMDTETYADKTPHPPAAIPLTDADRCLLPLQFAVDPGPDVTWSKDENDESIISKKSLSDEQKLELLNRYLDVLNVTKDPSGDKRSSPTPSEKVKQVSDGEIKLTLDSPKSPRGRHQLEKSRTLPVNFESDKKSSTSSNESRSAASCSAVDGSPGSKNAEKSSRSRALLQFLMLRTRFSFFGKSMRKSFKKNISSIARRGTSFRRKKTADSNPLLDTRRDGTDSNGATGGSTSPEKRSKNGDGTSDDKKSCHQKKDIYCAVLHTEKRHEYHEEMIRNYLNTARIRFLEFKKVNNHSSGTTDSSVKTSTLNANGTIHQSSSASPKPTVVQQRSGSSTSSSSSGSSSSSSAESSKSSSGDAKINGYSQSVDDHNAQNNYASQCVNSGCLNYGTPATSYLCKSCFADQKKEMLSQEQNHQRKSSETENISSNHSLIKVNGTNGSNHSSDHNNRINIVSNHKLEDSSDNEYMDASSEIPYLKSAGGKSSSSAPSSSEILSHKTTLDDYYSKKEYHKYSIYPE